MFKEYSTKSKIVIVFLAIDGEIYLFGDIF
jgi:hypothetical protein